MNKFGYLSVLLFLFLSCNGQEKKRAIKTLPSTEVSNTCFLNKEGTTIATRFTTPKGYTRIKTDKISFESYLQNFPLKPHGSKVYLYNGEEKYRQDVHSAVLDIDVGKRDLQQCADATIRLRAEYFYQLKQYNKISFNFTNGFKASYSKWRKGYRIKVKGNKVNWIKSAQPSTSYTSFRKYLTIVFSYAGTLSLEKELTAVAIEKLQIGDLFIKGGSPGHAIIVVDMAKNDEGEKVFLLAQSYMPAQDIHILKNSNNTARSPWYSATNLGQLNTPEWSFEWGDLKRF